MHVCMRAYKCIYVYVCINIKLLTPSEDFCIGVYLNVDILILSREKLHKMNNYIKVSNIMGK